MFSSLILGTSSSFCIGGRNNHWVCPAFSTPSRKIKAEGVFFGHFRILSILKLLLWWVCSSICSRAVPCSLGFPWCLLHLLSLQNFHQPCFLLPCGHQIKFSALFCEQIPSPGFSFAWIPGQSVFFCIIVEVLLIIPSNLCCWLISMWLLRISDLPLHSVGLAWYLLPWNFKLFLRGGLEILFFSSLGFTFWSFNFQFAWLSQTLKTTALLHGLKRANKTWAELELLYFKFK